MHSYYNLSLNMWTDYVNMDEKLCNLNIMAKFLVNCLSFFQVKKGIAFIIIAFWNTLSIRVLACLLIEKSIKMFILIQPDASVIGKLWAALSNAGLAQLVYSKPKTFPRQ